MSRTFSAAQRKDIAEAQQHASELLDLFRAWVPKRRATVRQLRDIASELRSVSQGVNAGRFVGTTAAVAGGVATVAGIGVTILTGGLAAPLIGLGIAGSVAGGVTSAASDIIGQYVSKDKMERAQKIMDEEAKLSEEIEQKKKTLDKMVDRLSTSLALDRDRIMGILFVANFINALSNNVFRTLRGPVTEMFLLTSLLGGTMFLASRITLEAVGKGASKAAVSVSLQSVVKVVGSVLKGVAVGAAGLVLLWDIYQWVGATIDLAEAKSGPADALGKVADELQKQMREIEAWLEDLKNQAKDYERTINEHFRKLLERISNNGYATEDEKEEVWQHVQRYADNDWKDTFLKHLNYDNFTFHLARVFSVLFKKVLEYLEEEEERKKRKLNITVISHGGIGVTSTIPCLFYYMNPYLTKVTLYEPWGCAIVASVVYGITTNTIQTSHVRYTGEVRPAVPSRFNELPRNLELTPNITLTPVKIGEPAYQDLMYLFAVLQGSSDGLVIPYFTGPGGDLLPFPTIPFWVFCNVLALIAAMTNTDITIRLAACLSVPKNERSSIRGHVPCSQYCTVDGSIDPPVIMSSTLGLPAELEGRLNALNEFL